MKYILTILFLSFTCICFSQTRSTKEVHDHHHEALLSKDVNAVMKDYDERSVLITPDGKVHKGTEEIRNTFEYAFREMFPPVIDLKIFQKTIEGQAVFLTYSVSDGESGMKLWDYAVDTFIIKDGKIRYQTVAIQLPEGAKTPDQN